MKELRNILEEAQRLSDRGEDFAIATVVKIGGSTYRRPGARMLVRNDGTHIGTISGGCLEGEVAMQALHVIESRQAQLVPFDLDEDDIVLGFGSGCNGIVHVLIQPIIATSVNTPVHALQFSFDRRKQGVLATVIISDNPERIPIGSHVLFLADGSEGPSTMPAEIVEPARNFGASVLSKVVIGAHQYVWQTQEFATESGPIEVLFEIINPPIKLVVFGEGHDVHAVLAQAQQVGWITHIVGRKPVDVLKARFPSADDWTFLMHPENVLDHIDLDRRSASLVMNHTYIRDKIVMQQLLAADSPFVGMLGPKERTATMVEELENEGHALSKEARDKLFGPVGLDIGTETPEEIALAAIAEIQAVLHHRSGGSLRKRMIPIHAERNPIESFRQV